MNDGIFVLLGSNQGTPLNKLAMAASKIESGAGKILVRSSIYKTAAWGLTDQPDFYNQVLRIESNYPADVLLKKFLKIEQAMGRERSQKWGPRVIDIDILFYGQEIWNTPELIIPHDGIPERRFALVPLTEIAGDWQHPVMNKTMTELLDQCEDRLAVTKCEIVKDALS